MSERPESVTETQGKQPLRGVVIGLGHQGMEHAESIFDYPETVIVGVADPVTETHETFRRRFPDHPALVRKDVQTLLDDLDTVPDFGIVAVPHDNYLETIELFCRLGVPVLKEKPLARNLGEVDELLGISDVEKFCFTALQRKYSLLDREMPNLLASVLSPTYFEYIYTLGHSHRATGWRDDKLQAGGGSLLDMGYHIVSRVIDWFGPPDSVQTVLGSNVKDMSASDTEVQAFLFLQYYEVGLRGLVTLSPVSNQKEESFQIFIPDGRRIIGQANQAELHGADGNLQVTIGTSRESLTALQLADFVRHVRTRSGFADNLEYHQAIMRVIDMCYQSQPKARSVLETRT